MNPTDSRPLTAASWEIRTCATRGPNELLWGDYHFARDLAAALESLSRVAWVTRRRETCAERADVVVHLRGNCPLPPEPNAINILWVISHPDQVSNEELNAPYDAIFSASRIWPGNRRTGGTATPLLQATNQHRFRPHRPDQKHPASGRLLFVGNARNGSRKIVSDCLQIGESPLVFGAGWLDTLPSKLYGGHYLPNEDLPQAYGAARFVLNDHWEDMRTEGFVSNRLFDATAAGAQCITDEVDGLDDLFGRMARTYSSLVSLRRALDTPPMTMPDRRVAAASIGHLESFDQRAAVLIKAAEAALLP